MGSSKSASHPVFRFLEFHSKIPGDAVFFPIAIAGGRFLARFVFHGVHGLGLGHRVVGPMRGLLEVFGRFRFFLGHTNQMRALALGFNGR